MSENAQRVLWFVYIIECRNKKLYTGITKDLVQRFHAHASGKGARFTKRNPPSHMIGARLCNTKSEACKEEYRIKGLRPEQKRKAALSWQEIKDLPKALI